MVDCTLLRNSMTNFLINIAGTLNVAYQPLPIIFYVFLRYEALKNNEGRGGQGTLRVPHGPSEPIYQSFSYSADILKYSVKADPPTKSPVLNSKTTRPNHSGAYTWYSGAQWYRTSLAPIRSRVPPATKPSVLKHGLQHNRTGGRCCKRICPLPVFHFILFDTGLSVPPQIAQNSLHRPGWAQTLTIVLPQPPEYRYGPPPWPSRQALIFNMRCMENSRRKQLPQGKGS